MNATLFEVGNEPSRSWITGGRVVPGLSASIYCWKFTHMAPSLREAHPHIKLGVGVGDTDNDVRWLQDFMTNCRAAREHMDWVSLHM